MSDSDTIAASQETNSHLSVRGDSAYSVFIKLARLRQDISISYMRMRP